MEDKEQGKFIENSYKYASYSSILIITLNMNGLNTPFKWETFIVVIKKQDPTTVNPWTTWVGNMGSFIHGFFFNKYCKCIFSSSWFPW